MASYDDINTVSKDAGFQGRCMYALYVAANTALSEVNTTANHQVRVDFARKIIAGSYDAQALPLARALLTISSLNSTLVAATTPDFGMTDAQIQTAVTNAYNALAGVAT